MSDTKIMTREQVRLRLDVAWRYKYTPVQIEAARQLDESDAALRELVRDFAADQIEAFISRKPCLYNEDRPHGAPEEFYLQCDQCGSLGPDDAYAIEHDKDCSAGRLLARAREAANV